MIHHRLDLPGSILECQRDSANSRYLGMDSIAARIDYYLRSMDSDLFHRRFEQ